MKNILNQFTILLVFVLFSGSALAQQKAAEPAMTAKDSSLCKSWKLDEIEEFGVKEKPPITQETDGISFGLDKKVTQTMNGKVQSGTWTTDKAKTWVYVSIPGTNKMNYKLIKIEQNLLVLEHQNADLIRTKYHFVAVSKE